ncbi:MAG: hypothetical protein ACK5IC_10345 [Moheibacter sp.]
MSNSLNQELKKPGYTLQPWQQTKVFQVNREIESGKIKLNHAFEFHLNYLRQQNKNHYISIVRNNYKINDKDPDLLISKIAHELQQSLYPMVFSIDETGKILGIENFSIIQDNWNRQKQLIQNKYEGEGTLLIIQSMEKRLESKMTFYKSTTNDLAHIGLFLPVYHSYDSSLKIESETMSLPILGKNEITVLGELTLENEPGTKPTFRFHGKPALTEEQENQLKERLKKQQIDINSEKLEGDIQFTTDLSNTPFGKTDISIELNLGEKWTYKEKLEYRFKRVIIPQSRFLSD